MTVYFDRTKVKTPEEIQQQQNVEAVGAIVNFFAKPAILWGTWNLVIPSLFGLPPIWIPTITWSICNLSYIIR